MNADNTTTNNNESNKCILTCLQPKAETLSQLKQSAMIIFFNFFSVQRYYFCV